MRHLLIQAVMVLVPFLAIGRTVDIGKPAILMVHFGTTFDDTRAATIDVMNAEVCAAFPEAEVVEAYTSRIVIKRLAARGIKRLTPQEALLRLAADGYKQVFVQSTNIIEGIEMAVLRSEVAAMEPFFDDIRVGRPLLYSVEDCLRVSDIISSRHAEAMSKEGDALVFIGHGSDGPANAVYSQIDYMLSAQGHDKAHVATVEGYPTYDTVVSRLRAGKSRHVTLVPLMFVAGDHARNDIDSDWRGRLEVMGFDVSTVIEGLGQVSEIREIYISHIREGLAERPLNAVERKAGYLKKNL